MKIRFRKGKDGDQMTVLDGQQEPQEMENRDRIDIAKNRCAIVFESMQLTAEEIFESVSVLVDDNEDEEEDDGAPDSLTVMEHVVMALAVIALAMVIVTLA